jgi:hypothetical protein
MSYHSEFWLAVGAAAPVIALAAVVSKAEVAYLRIKFFTSPFPILADSTDTRDEKVALDNDAKALLYKWATLLNWLVNANLLMQVAAVAVALLSLAREQDQVPLLVLAVIEPLGVLLLAITGSSAISLRIAPEYIPKLTWFFQAAPDTLPLRRAKIKAWLEEQKRRESGGSSNQLQQVESECPSCPFRGTSDLQGCDP